MSPMLIAFNKPFNVLCQFTDSSQPPRATTAGFGLPPDVYAAGRLDYDSEGLLLLTDDGRLAHRLTDPRHKEDKTYWVQVEGTPTDEQVQALRRGVQLNDGPTLPARVEHLETRRCGAHAAGAVPQDRADAAGDHPARRAQPPVRRMTAAVGLPTLRLVRVAMGPHRLEDLQPGRWRRID